MRHIREYLSIYIGIIMICSGFYRLRYVFHISEGQKEATACLFIFGVACIVMNFAESDISFSDLMSKKAKFDRYVKKLAKTTDEEEKCKMVNYILDSEYLRREDIHTVLRYTEPNTKGNDRALDKLFEILEKIEKIETSQ
jgi:hypothetical protein